MAFVLTIRVIFLSLYIFIMAKCEYMRINQNGYNTKCFRCDCYNICNGKSKRVQNKSILYPGLFQTKQHFLQVQQNLHEQGSVESSIVLWTEYSMDTIFTTESVIPVSSSRTTSFIPEPTTSTMASKQQIATTGKHSTARPISSSYPEAFTKSTPYVTSKTTMAGQAISTTSSTKLLTYTKHLSSSVAQKTQHTASKSEQPISKPDTTSRPRPLATTTPLPRPVTTTTRMFATRRRTTTGQSLTQTKVTTLSGCCKTKWEAIALKTVKLRKKIYNVIHYDDSYQIIFKGSCAEKNSRCLGTGICKEEYSFIYVLVDDDTAEAGVRFIPINIPRYCRCVNIGKKD